MILNLHFKMYHVRAPCLSPSLSLDLAYPIVANTGRILRRKPNIRKVYKFVHLLTIADFELLHGVYPASNSSIFSSYFNICSKWKNIFRRWTICCCFSLKYISKLQIVKGTLT